MVRQADREMTVIKKEVFTHSSLDTGSDVTHHGEVTQWNSWVSKEAEGAGEIEGKSLYYGLCARKWVRHGK